MKERKQLLAIAEFSVGETTYSNGQVFIVEDKVARSLLSAGLAVEMDRHWNKNIDISKLKNTKEL